MNVHHKAQKVKVILMAVMKVVIINNTYRKAIWSFLSNYPVASRIALSADRRHSWCKISLIKQLKQKIKKKKKASYLLTIQPWGSVFAISARNSLLNPSDMTRIVLTGYINIES